MCDKRVCCIFFWGKFLLEYIRGNNISNETIQTRHSHWRIIIFKESTMARVIML